MPNGDGRRQRQRQLQKINRYSKTGNKKRAIFFATLLQNELNNDVVCFTPREKKNLQQIGLSVGGILATSLMNSFCTNVISRPSSCPVIHISDDINV